MTDDELLRVAAERETLVTDAVVAIDTELARRGFSVATATKETKRTERNVKRRVAPFIPKLHPMGWARMSTLAQKKGSGIAKVESPGTEEIRLGLSR
jgi:hypothetical protein